MTRLVAFNLVEINLDFELGECPYCVAQFRVTRAVISGDDYSSIPTVDSAIVCPNCGEVSFLFCWMDTTSIPRSRKFW